LTDGIRLLPITRIALCCLLLLKLCALALTGETTFGQFAAKAGISLDGASRDAVRVAEADPIVTGSTPPPKTDPPAEPPRESGQPGEAETRPIAGLPPSSPSERALLDSLGKRREELDARARELDLRENLIGAAEKRIELRINELKAIEERIGGLDAKQSEAEKAKLKSLVVMYEAMKPREAARIFDRLELGVLVQVVDSMNPRKVADVLGQMQPETAERLTMELATRGKPRPQADTAFADLPKIEGKPSAAAPAAR
jgi:flagellar motility protein MotE (MotC chaperone)